VLVVTGTCGVPDLPAGADAVLPLSPLKGIHPQPPIIKAQPISWAVRRTRTPVFGECVYLMNLSSL
jgi:hypothetical protein